MSEMSLGTKDINRSVSEVVEASAEMSESISGMDRMIRGNSGAVESVRDKAAKALSSLEAVEASFRGMVARSGNVRALGMRSDEVIRELDESIRAI